MDIINKLKLNSRTFRITFGVILIAIAIFTGNSWFYLGVIPLIVGITNFCPACVILKKCDINRGK